MYNDIPKFIHIYIHVSVICQFYVIHNHISYFVYVHRNEYISGYLDFKQITHIFKDTNIYLLVHFSIYPSNFWLISENMFASDTHWDKEVFKRLQVIKIPLDF